MAIMRARMPLPRIEVHQHLWPEAYVAALARRTEPPALRRSAGADWLLRLARGPEAPLALAPQDPATRIDVLRADGVDRALLCLSTPLGIETLPRAEAQPLL